jgi:hypothetical protein
VLGVAPDASALEVRSAYLALVRAWHPDRFASHESRAAEAEERLKAINAAYDESRAWRWETRSSERYERSGWEAADGYHEWADVADPGAFKLLLVPSGLVVRGVALVLAILITLLAVVHTLNVLDLVR